VNTSRASVTTGAAALALLVSACTASPPTSAPAAAPLPEPTRPLLFEDVTEQVGIEHTHTPDGRKTLPPNCVFSTANATADSRTDLFDCVEERQSGGVAVGDVTSNGHPDLYFTRIGAPGVLYVNDGTGHFTDHTAAAGLDTVDVDTAGAGFADLTSNGHLDLYITTLGAEQHLLYINDGTGHFTEQAQRRGAAVLSDLPRGGASVNFGDVNRDGLLDIHVADWVSQQRFSPTWSPHTRLLRNRTEQPGTFEDITTIAAAEIRRPLTDDLHRPVPVPDDRRPSMTFASALADLSGNGWPDLVTAGDQGTSALLRNTSHGTFVDESDTAGIGIEISSMGLALADLNGNGRLDMFVSAIADPDRSCNGRPCEPQGYRGNALYINNGDLSFTEVADAAGVRDAGWAWGAAFADFSNRGHHDLFVTSGWSLGGERGVGFHRFDQYDPSPSYLYQQLPGAQLQFVEVAEQSGITSYASGRGVAIADLDGDGRLDIIVANNAEMPTIYRNSTPDSGNWLRVNVAGRGAGATNRDGYGARVSATIDGRTATYEVGAATHFLGQSERTLHIGAADAPAVDELVAHFPATGRTVTLTDIPTNQTITVREPAN